MHEVNVVISCQWAVFDGWDGACIDRGTVKWVVDKEEKEHGKGTDAKGTG